jgi:hypothetical protein
MSVTSGSETEVVLTKLRTSLKRRGAEGIRGLARHFKARRTSCHLCATVRTAPLSCRMIRVTAPMSSVAARIVATDAAVKMTV